MASKLHEQTRKIVISEIRKVFDKGKIYSENCRIKVDHPEIKSRIMDLGILEDEADKVARNIRKLLIVDHFRRVDIKRGFSGYSIIFQFNPTIERGEYAE